MKPRLLASLAALSLATFARPALAQAGSYQPVRVDLTVYGAYGSADANAWGIGAAIEPKYNVTDNLAAGLRLEGAAFVTQQVTVGPAGSDQVAISQGARTLTAYLAKADWYFTTAPVRPFAGLGLGLYRLAAGSQEVSGTGAISQRAEAFSGFGFCPQLGVNFGGFRLAATYHVITGGSQTVATQTIGTTAVIETRLSKNFFAFEIGGTIGGNRLGP